MTFKNIPAIIKTPVGNNKASDPDDIRKIRYLLNEQGYKDKNLDFGYIDSHLDKNIKAFQKDNKLPADGVILPNGPTIKMLTKYSGDIEEAARSPTWPCTLCTRPHGGVYNSKICDQCIKRGDGEPEP